MMVSGRLLSKTRVKHELIRTARNVAAPNGASCSVPLLSVRVPTCSAPRATHGRHDQPSELRSGLHQARAPISKACTRFRK